VQRLRFSNFDNFYIKLNARNTETFLQWWLVCHSTNCSVYLAYKLISIHCRALMPNEQESSPKQKSCKAWRAAVWPEARRAEMWGRRPRAGVGFWGRAASSGECCELHQWGSGWSPGRKRILEHSERRNCVRRHNISC